MSPSEGVCVCVECAWLSLVGSGHIYRHDTKKMAASVRGQQLGWRKSVEDLPGDIRASYASICLNLNGGSSFIL